MKIRGVVGFANNDFPSFVGFNELTIRVSTEETQEYWGEAVSKPPGTREITECRPGFPTTARELSPVGAAHE